MSGRIPIEFAQPRAERRMIQVFNEKFETMLDEVVTDAGEQGLFANPATPEPGLTQYGWPVPTADDYYEMKPRSFNESVDNFSCGVFVYCPNGTRSDSDIQGGSGANFHKTLRYNLHVVLYFRMEAYQPITDLGRELTSKEVFGRRAERYIGAILKTVYKFAPGSNSIDDVDVLHTDRDTNRQDVDDSDKNRLWGVAFTRWEIKQRTLVPRRQVGAVGDSTL